MKSQVEIGGGAKKKKLKRALVWFPSSEGKAGLAWTGVCKEISSVCLCLIEKLSAFAKLCHRDNLCPKKAREDSASNPALGRRPKLEGVSCSAPVFSRPHNWTQQLDTITQQLKCSIYPTPQPDTTAVFTPTCSIYPTTQLDTTIRHNYSKFVSVKT